MTPQPTKPSYWCAVSTCVTYSDDSLHNPIGIPGSIFCDPLGAMVLFSRSVGGRLPLDQFKAGDEVIIQFPTAIINGLSRADSARFLPETYVESVRELVRTLVRRGVRVILYIGSLQDSPDPAVARQAVLLYGSECWRLACGLIIDAAAVAKAEPFIDTLVAVAKSQKSAGLPFGVEGMWSPAMYNALGELVTHHVIERQTVERSFTDAKHPAWKQVARPDPAKVLIWDQRGDWSTVDAAGWAAKKGLPQAVSGMVSAIGAETWRPGTPGNPRLAVSRQDNEARKLLGLPAEGVQA